MRIPGYVLILSLLNQVTRADACQQYAMVVRRNPNGGYTPLIKGQSWATSQPWSMVLQGLLDTTATLIHKTIGQATMPQLGLYEELPRYSPQAQRT